MMSKAKFGIGSGVCLVALAGGWFVWLQIESSQREKQATSAQIAASATYSRGPLDGMTFSGFVGSPANPNRTKDKFVFSDGKFVSTECSRICGYVPGAYFIREQNGKTEFLSISRCKYKDAEIVWRGTIDNGTVKGESVWTVNRWYRTIQKRLVFKGKLVNASRPVAAR